MTDEQYKIFSELLDTNQKFKTEKVNSVKWDLAMRVNDLKKELKESMGEETYNQFMNAGEKMFQPKKKKDE